MKLRPLHDRVIVKRLEQETKFYADELERTRVRAIAAGWLVTPDLGFNPGKYLKEGELFAEVEDHGFARGEIAVPETDIGEVQIGDDVRLKAWAWSETEKLGRVVAIAPNAEEREYGKVVRVMTEVPNDDQSLRPEMTGYSKITGSEMPVWRAYSRMLARFFVIEVWSWIP